MIARFTFLLRLLFWGGFSFTIAFRSVPYATIDGGIKRECLFLIHLLLEVFWLETAYPRMCL